MQTFSGERKRVKRRSFLTAVGVGIGTFVGIETGQAQDETEIQDWHDLDGIRDDLTGEYVLTATLDADSAGYDEYVGDASEGWEPIGTSDTEFTGTLTGGNRAIADLQIHREESAEIGLFGAVADATIEQVHLTNLSVEGDSNVGGLAGSNLGGDVMGCLARGDVVGRQNVGGLTGGNAGGIRQSASSAVVSGERSVGGITGTNDGGEIIEVAVGGEATGDRNVGGIAGTNNGGTIRSSASLVDVAGDQQVGGIAGLNSLVVSKSYAAGSVTAQQRVGGLVGVNTNELTDLYWDSETTDQSEGVGGDDGTSEITGLSTADMQGARATDRMSGLDFEQTWHVVTDPDGYPQLHWQTGEELDSAGHTVSSGEQSSADDNGPGFGISGSLAGAGGVGYFLYRRHTDND